MREQLLLLSELKTLLLSIVSLYHTNPRQPAAGRQVPVQTTTCTDTELRQVVSCSPLYHS